jgi:hypothetical protein
MFWKKFRFEKFHFESSLNLKNVWTKKGSKFKDVHIQNLNMNKFQIWMKFQFAQILNLHKFWIWTKFKLEQNLN